VLSGVLPPAVTDARRNLATRDLPVTRELVIGSYAGVPWTGPDGRVAGMVCCVSRHPDPALDERAIWFLEFVAGMIGQQMAGTAPAAAGGPGADVRGLFDDDTLRMVFQPVVRLRDGFVEVFEALARFDRTVFATPDRAFAAATRAGLGVDLEHLAVRRAFRRLHDLPGDTMLGVNLSAEALLDDRVQTTLLDHAPRRRIGVEITEHAAVHDYLDLIGVTERLRAAGVLIVVDDAGAGYASLHHILQLRPDVIKLDVALVRGIDGDRARQALARSLVSFAADIGAHLVAEGIETPAERDLLRRLGVGYGQGYLLGRPAGLSAPAASRVSR
jgi:EAL domain-containing protein (putative c-di-GMP-specific phosphodiesterase class I)